MQINLKVINVALIINIHSHKHMKNYKNPTKNFHVHYKKTNKIYNKHLKNILLKIIFWMNYSINNYTLLIISSGVHGRER